jgi:hypothetical protein
MFDDRATPRSPFVVAYSPRSHPDTPADFSLTSTLRLLIRHFLLATQAIKNQGYALLLKANPQ